MNRNVNIFKKISMFRLYKKNIRDISTELENRFNIRIDDANRMYTVLNIPEEIIGEAYAIKKSDIDRIADNYIRAYSQELGAFLNTNGVSELYDFYELRKVDKYSYLIVVGFSLFRTDERRNRLIKYWLPFGIGGIILASLLLLL